MMGLLKERRGICPTHGSWSQRQSFPGEQLGCLECQTQARFAASRRRNVERVAELVLPAVIMSGGGVKSHQADIEKAVCQAFRIAEEFVSKTQLP